MAYTQGFDYDIFISFSHLDNQTLPGASDSDGGWIEQFRNQLETWLTSRGFAGLKVWWDIERLGGNTDFDQRIKDDLGRTALFFVIHSRNYRDSVYCEKEMDWFVEQAKSHSLGLTVDGNRRLFNILINNIPYTEWTNTGHWTDPLKGTTGFPCHNAEKREDFGDPLRPKAESQRFTDALRAIIDSATTTLKAFPKEAPQVHPPADSDRPILFIADVADTQAKLRRRLIKEIGDRARILDTIPPPYPEAEHDAALDNVLQQADLTIHLLCASPGREMDDAEVSYPHRQADVAAAAEPLTLLWLPDTVALEMIEDDEHKAWLRSFETGARADQRYQFQRGSRERLISDLLDRIERLSKARAQPDTGPRGILIDPHRQDQSYGFELAAGLTRDHPELNIRITSDADKPADSWSGFDNLVAQTQDLVVLFGRVDPGWVKGRVEHAFKVAATQAETTLESIWVLLLPDCHEETVLRRLPKFIRVEILDNRNASHIAEETLHRLLLDNPLEAG